MNMLMRKLKRLMLIGLSNGLAFCCDLLHWVPGYRCKLAIISYKLDQKYNLGVWRKD